VEGGGNLRNYGTTMKRYAKQLRKDMTPEERHLWYDFLSSHQCHFRRQQILGKYIADFYSAECRLVIELDGGQHYEENGLNYDELRTHYLENLGIYVIRFTNTDVKRNFAGVCQVIDRVIRARKEDKRPPSASFCSAPPP
jgi:very-short-patch-repair endonuclease